jgi:hypothetical protein
VEAEPDADVAELLAFVAEVEAALALAAAAVSDAAAFVSEVAAAAAADTAADKSTIAIGTAGLPDASKLMTLFARLAALGSAVIASGARMPFPTSTSTASSALPIA